MHTHFFPFPTLYTARLQLRALRPTDAPEIFIHRSDPRMLEFVDIVAARELADAEQFIQQIQDGIAAGHWIYWGITLRERSLLIGTICLWHLLPETSTAEIGYMLHPDFQRQGYMQEAIISVINYGFTSMQVRTLVALPQTENIASIRLLERNRFVHSGDKGGYGLFALHSVEEESTVRAALR